MEIMENPNPNSHDTSKSWSDLPLDLLNSVFERLGFADFQRAKSICSSWHSASKQSVPKNQIHWLILFPEHNNNDSRCTLFNPEEKDKLYKTKDLGFIESVCIATYGSWLLIENHLGNLYIVNLFNEHVINLPHPGSQIQVKQSPVFWIDEKTKDYVVLFGRPRGVCNVVYCSSKNNLLWNQIPETSLCMRLVYKDHKLYFLNFYGIFKIFDFSSSPEQIFQCDVGEHRSPSAHTLNLVVNVTGEVVFMVEKFLRVKSINWWVFKVFSLKKKEVVNSLGDEAMLLDQGITVVASEGGFVRNSIYFSDSIGFGENHGIFIFNLETKKTKLLHRFDSSSSIQKISRSRWFLPSFTHHT